MKCVAVQSILSLFRCQLNKFNHTEAQILDFINDMTLKNYLEILFSAWKCQYVDC